MTAVNILVTPDEATIVTDTLTVQPAGLRFQAAKCVPIPHMQLAIATRGTLSANDMMARLISMHAHDFDTARAYLNENFLRLSKVHYQDESERQAWQNGIDLFVAGWSRRGPAAFSISTLNTDFRVMDIPYLVATPTIPPEEFDALAGDPIANMPDILAAQARIDRSVGGFMNVTTVSEREIVSYTAGRIPVAAAQSQTQPGPRLPDAFAKYLRKDQ